MEPKSYDVVIVGGGAAGLSAALVLGRARRRVAVIDAGAPRNTPAAHMQGYLSRDGMPPADLLAAGHAEVTGYGVEIIEDTVLGIDPGFTVHLGTGSGLTARRILVATGVTDRVPDLPGVEERWGRDLLHCPYCHGWEVRDQPLGVLGSNPGSIAHAQLIRQWSDDVIYFAHTQVPTPAEAAALDARGIQVVHGEVAGLVVDDDHLTGVELADGRIVARSAVFVRPIIAPHPDYLLAHLGCELDDAGFAVVDSTGRTTVAGIWGAGNAVDPRAQVITAAGAGSAAAIAINADLLRDDITAAVSTVKVIACCAVEHERESEAERRRSTNGATMNAGTASSPTTPGPMMRAIVQDRYGTDPDAVLRVADLPRPGIGDEGVLVRVVAAGVDRGTVHCMTGLPYAMRLAGFGVRSPKASNPGRALAGIVDSVGASVTGFRPGDEVYGSCDGSFSEYAAVDVAQLAAKPTNLSFEQAATVPISAATALQAMRTTGVQTGQRVLILGASGGVGTFAVQIGRAFGAEVTGVCSTSKVDLVRSLGADQVLDYTVDDITDGALAYDVVLDIGGNRSLSHLRRALTPKGVLLIIGGETSGRWLGGFDRSLRAVLLSPFVSQSLGMLVSTEQADDLDALRELLESGQVTPALDRSYSLAEAGEAIRYVSEGKARGKVVITI